MDVKRSEAGENIAYHGLGKVVLIGDDMGSSLAVDADDGTCFVVLPGAKTENTDLVITPVGTLGYGVEVICLDDSAFTLAVKNDGGNPSTERTIASGTKERVVLTDDGTDLALAAPGIFPLA